MSPIDLNRIRVRSHGSPSEGSRPARPTRGQHFLKGPVPLPWLERAAKLPGKSLHVGIAVWYVAGLTRSRRVPLSNVAGHRFGLDRNAKYRALEWLEGAGLIRVERKLGRAPVVTLLDFEAVP
jgi:hypothetical protein